MINEIYFGKCEDLFSRLTDNSIDLTILDPPYNVNADSWDNIDNYFDWLCFILKESVRVTKPTGSIYLWGMASKNNDFLKIKLWLDINITKFYFKNWIVWVHEVKIHRRPKDRYLTKHEDLLFYAADNSTFNLVRDDPPPFQLKMHAGRYDEKYFISREKLPPSQQKRFKNGLQLGSPAKSWWKGPSNQSAAKIYKGFSGYKSEWVSERIIKVSSNENDTILIPFAGSGTECVCAKRLGRNFIASENLEKHYIWAKDRISNEI
jgi:site-specific DNA-methyltransferase (adenine-specific)